MNVSMLNADDFRISVAALPSSFRFVVGDLQLEAYVGPDDVLFLSVVQLLDDEGNKHYYQISGHDAKFSHGLLLRAIKISYECTELILDAVHQGIEAAAVEKIVKDELDLVTASVKKELIG